MTDAELSARMRENIIAFKHLQGVHGAPHHLGLPGVDAFALTPRPDALHQQLVLYARAEALPAALAPLEAFFRGHGIPAWRVSVPHADAEAARLLSLAGYQPGDAVPVMAVPLEGVSEPLALPPPGLPLERPASLAELIALNEEAFEERMAHLGDWGARVAPPVHALQVREAGRVLAAGLSVDTADVTGIYLVATASEARRRGLASALMWGLLREAQARGRAAAVLQATPLGHGVYRRMGFRDVDTWTNWVRRVA